MGAEKRLERLEHSLGRQTCPRCYGHPSRLVYVDSDTGEETDETMPESGCPECGRAIYREYRIIGCAGADRP